MRWTLIKELRQVVFLRELGAMDAIPAGARVHVEEDGFVYTGVGNVAAGIARRIGWTHANVWIPDHALKQIATRHKPLLDPIAVAELVLMNPLSVHEGTRAANHVYFIIDANAVRNAGILQSRTARFVDAVVELRHLNGEVLPRLFHLSPRGVNQGGKQLWP